MRVRLLPRALRERLRKTFEAQYPNKRLFDASTLESGFSSSVVSEVRAAICMRLFSRTPVFNDAPPAFLSAIAGVLTIELALSGDTLAVEGEALQRVIFIEAGKVRVALSGCPLQ